MSDQHHTQSPTGAPREPSPHNEPDYGPGPSEHEHESEAAHRHEQQCLEFCPICRAADILRASAPPELREQWQTVQREALMTTKALIEHYLSRLDDGPPEPPSRVEDIPIF